jgi:hypothetical protein
MVQTEITHTETAPMINTTTLAQRLTGGQLPVGDALRYAVQLGDALRRIHDSGQCHGALTPANISIGATGADLLPASEASIGSVTGYTAPEVLEGRPADARSDIFSFGAILFEMLTGRRAFEGEGRTTLTARITTAPTPTSGSPSADRLIGPCLAKNPDARAQRLQKILLELKLLSVAARRAAAPTVRRGVRSDDGVELEVMRAEIQQMEARFAARLNAHERCVAEMQRSATEAVGTLKQQIFALGAELGAAQERASERPAENGMDEAASERILAQVDRGFEAVGEHVNRLEKVVEDMRRHAGQFEHSVAADLVDIEHNLKVQSTAIESARTAMSQTDDLVERVVEALESLQTAMLEPGEPAGEREAFAVN